MTPVQDAERLILIAGRAACDRLGIHGAVREQVVWMLIEVLREARRRAVPPRTVAERLRVEGN